MSNGSTCCDSDGDAEGVVTANANVVALATAAAVAEALGVAGLRMEFDPALARLVAHALRVIATGEPLTREAVRDLAHDLDDPDDVVTAVMRIVESDARERIIGVLGLSQGRHPHAFTVGGHTLSTWCAWDALFLAPVLGEPADVRSRDPATGATIDVRVAPDGVAGPEATVCRSSSQRPRRTNRGTRHGRRRCFAVSCTSSKTDVRRRAGLPTGRCLQCSSRSRRRFAWDSCGSAR